jgi:hypothetical protein
MRCRHALENFFLRYFVNIWVEFVSLGLARYMSDLPGQNKVGYT